MDPVEKAIRNALQKGNAQDRAYRERVYGSARAALQRTLDANSSVTSEVAERRRRALSARIAQIESEFVPALATEPSQAAPPPDNAPEAPPREPVMEPSIGPLRAEPPMEEGAWAASFPGIDPADRAERSRLNAPPTVRRPARATKKRSGSLAARLTGLVLFLVLAAALGYGAWFALQSGLIGGSPQTVDPGETEPAVEEAATAPSETPDDDENWINVFRPTDLTQVSAPPDGGAESMEREGEQLVRVDSGASGAVSFEIGQGVLEQIAGRRATFNIIARAQDEDEAQISVGCDFNVLGDCGRRRFQIGPSRQDLLFELGLPDAQPARAGHIMINTAIEGESRAIDIYAIRVSVGG